VTLLRQEGWTRPTEVPSNPYYSVILFTSSSVLRATLVMSKELGVDSGSAGQKSWETPLQSAHPHTFSTHHNLKAQVSYQVWRE